MQYKQAINQWTKSVMRLVWRVLPRRIGLFLLMKWKRWRIRYPLRRLDNFTPAAAPVGKGAPVAIAGLFRSGQGVGAAARSTYHALEAVNANPLACDVTKHFLPLDLDTDVPISEFPQHFTGTLILHLNPPQMAPALSKLWNREQGYWRVIGYWAWELPAFPLAWDETFPLVSQVWTLSEFVAECLRQHPDSPAVHAVPPAISLPESTTPDRRRFHIPQDVFVVLVVADASSSFRRKNPVGSIEAFRMAFGDREDCILCLKTRNTGIVPAAAEALREAVGSARNILHFDRTLSQADHWSLLSSADCLLSLHRSEGFGLPLAEAMALGKPVVATGWSGNMSFMTEASSLPVKYDFVHVDDPYGPYDGYDSHWAEPNIRHAAELLDRLKTDASLAQRLSTAAPERVKAVCGPEVVGKKMVGLLGG